MNTIPAQEIKRRGIAAVDELIAKGDVHIIRNNQPQYVVLSQERYEELLEAQEEAQRGSYPRVAGRPQGGPGEAGHRRRFDPGLDWKTEQHVHARLDGAFTRPAESSCATHPGTARRSSRRSARSGKRSVPAAPEIPPPWRQAEGCPGRQHHIRLPHHPHD